MTAIIENPGMVAGAWLVAGAAVSQLFNYLQNRSKAADTSHESQVRDLNAHIGRLETANNALHEKHGELMGQMSLLAATVSKLEAQLQHFQAVNAELLERDTRRQNILSTYEMTNAHLTEENTALKVENAKLVAENALLKARLPDTHPASNHEQAPH